MDVHRLKFLDIKPHSILSLAFNGSKETPKIAVSRSDGSIELWSLLNDEDRELVHQATIPGRADVSVEVTAWCKQRLFTAGLSGTVNEWDTTNLCCVGSVDALGSPIWCLDCDATLERLAAGTNDGKICLYDIANNTLSFSRTLAHQNCRILSLCFHPKGFHIAIGCSDSTVRIVDTESGQCTLRILVGKVQNKETLIWSVRFLSNFNIITGSSSGRVQFWNGQFGTLKHSYQSHLADVLTLDVSEQEDCVYASGIDAKVVQFKRVGEDSGTAVWVQCKGVRAHTHDVKSLSVVSGKCVASGGIDTELVLYSTQDFDVSKTTRYSPFSSWFSRFKYSSSSNTLMYQGCNSLKFWRITPKQSQIFNSSSSCSPDKDALQRTNCLSPCPSESNISLPSLNSSVESDLLVSSGLPVNFLELRTPTVEHILTSALSDDGKVVVLSCNNKTWVYSVSHSVLCVCCCDISACSIAIKQDSSEAVLGLARGGLSRSKLPVPLEKHSSLAFDPLFKQKDKLSHKFCKVEYSPCGGYLLAMNLKFRMFLYETDSFTCLAKLPRLDDYRPPCPVFDPTFPHLHIFASSSNELYTFNIKTAALALSGSLACPKFRGLNCMTGFCVSFNPQYLIAYNTNNLVLISKDRTDVTITQSVRAGRKRQNESDSVALPYKMFKHYRDILFVTPLQCGSELLVIEKPWEDVLNGLPPVIERKQYAT